MNKEQFEKYPDGFYMWFSGEKEYYVTAIWQYQSKIIDQKDERYIKLKKDIIKTKASSKKAQYFVPYLDKPFSNKLGTLLLDFLNADFSMFEKAYNTFFYKYGFSFITDKYIEKLDSAKENEMYLSMYEHYSMNTFFFREWQIVYRKFIDYVYSLGDYSNSKSSEYSKMSKFEAYAIMDDAICRDSKNIEIRSDNYLERHYLTRDIDSVEELTGLIEKKDSRFISNDVYFFKDLGKAIFMDFKMLVTNDNIAVKQCKNCGKYFQPVNRHAEVYCSLPNIDGSPTCKEKGAGETYRKNIKEIDGLLTYRRTYQKRIMEVSRNRENTDLKDKFDNWKKKAQEKIKAFKENKISEDELNNWMQANKDI